MSDPHNPRKSLFCWRKSRPVRIGMPGGVGVIRHA